MIVRYPYIFSQPFDGICEVFSDYFSNGLPKSVAIESIEERVDFFMGHADLLDDSGVLPWDLFAVGIDEIESCLPILLQ